jgi:Zn finger protein HypA/HybF involved in hydrogenase expression
MAACIGERMKIPPSTLERAFELARSGDYASSAEIRLQLKRERHDQVEAHLQGPSISRQLRLICEEASKSRTAAAATPAAAPSPEASAS